VATVFFDVRGASEAPRIVHGLWSTSRSRTAALKTEDTKPYTRAVIVLPVCPCNLAYQEVTSREEIARSDFLPSSSCVRNLST
jgi:hypothetical protein